MRRRGAARRPEGAATFESEAVSGSGEETPICPLCERPIPPSAKQSLHHLIPVSKGGRNGLTALVHQICHNEIHAAATEAELARSYASFEALRAHPKLARFIAWVADKDPCFHSRSHGNHRKRRRGRK